MSQNHSSDPHPTIGQRLEELPYVVYRQITYDLIQKKHVNRRTFYRVLHGKSNNLKVVVALAKFLDCSVEQVLDPEFNFPDPRKSPKRRARLINRLGAKLSD